MLFIYTVVTYKPITAKKICSKLKNNGNKLLSTDFQPLNNNKLRINNIFITNGVCKKLPVKP